VAFGLTLHEAHKAERELDEMTGRSNDNDWER